MCGRYYVDEELQRELQRWNDIGDEVGKEKRKIQGDIHPSDQAVVLYAGIDTIQKEWMSWGFPNFHRNGVIFNARSESAMEKPFFRSSVRDRRCVIPARAFYEWDSSKNKIIFQKKDHSVLYMAGFFKSYDGEKRFVILTTQANSSVKDVHDRMPLILEEQELEEWIFSEQRTDEFLKKIPPVLVQKAEYQQVRFDFLG